MALFITISPIPSRPSRLTYYLNGHCAHFYWEWNSLSNPLFVEWKNILINQITYKFGRSTLVGKRHMKSPLSVFLSVCPPVRPSLLPSVTKFSQDWIISFSWYCTQQLTMTRIGGLNLGPIGLNQAQNEVFRNFLEFGSLVFHKIAYNVDCINV